MRDDESHPIPDYPPGVNHYNVLRDILNFGQDKAFRNCTLQDLDARGRVPSWEDEDLKFVSLVNRTLSGKSFVKTPCGHFGLVYENAMVKPADEIWILFGCRMPVVLRPEGGAYRFITPIYLFGYMNGEVMWDVKGSLQDGDAIRSVENGENFAYFVHTINLY